MSVLNLSVSILLLLLAASFASAFEFNAENSVLLICPLHSRADLDYIVGLQAQGHPIDIFEEKVSTDKDAVVQLLTDMATSEILLSRAGCFEEKGRSAVRKLFNIDAATTPRTGPNFHDDYRSYQNIIDQLNYYASVHPQRVKAVKTIGKSHEGRDLVVIHLTAATNSLGDKPLVWIMAGQHAREWISTSSAFVLLQELLKPDANPALLDNFEFAVMPLVNPDGYEYTRARNRMWRKNRRGFYGVDLNRNWDHKWCEIGSSREPARDDYCGPSPASEPEIFHTQKYILSLPKRIIGFDIHSYGQLILRNYGWTKKPSPIERGLSTISALMAKSIYDLTGQRYTPKQSSDLYPSSGSAEDWLYVKAGIPGIIIEMRDTGRHGFHLPSSHIKPAGLELYISIITAVLNYEKIKSQSKK